MEIRKLKTWQEWLESDRLIATAFLQDWKEEESKKQFQAQAEGKEPRTESAWGAICDDGRMASTIVTRPQTRIFEGAAVGTGDVNMVGSLPEYRGGGNIRALMRAVLGEFRERGDLFATLHPFSFAFYRKFGFELGARALNQTLPIDQLAPFTCRYSVRRLENQTDCDAIRALYERWILDKSLAALRGDASWAYRENGEYGQRNWWLGNRQEYTYLFSDETGFLRAYLKFAFAEGKEGPMTGTMEVRELIFDSPEALRNVLGFIYGMRAKVVEVSVSMDEDLTLLVPECDRVKQEPEGHTMVRVLDVPAVLSHLRCQETGACVIEVADDFLPDNSGVYSLRFGPEGTEVTRGEAEPDLCVSIQTLSQLVIGRITAKEAALRADTQVRGNQAAPDRLFVRKPICL